MHENQSIQPTNNSETTWRVSRWPVRHPWKTVVIVLILVSIAAIGGRHLSFTNNYRVFFSQDNPELRAFDALQERYSKSDNLLFVVAPKDGQVFTKETLTLIHALTEQAWQLPYSTRVDSIANFQHTIAEDNDLIVGNLVDAPAALTDERIRDIENVALREPALVGRLVSSNGHVAGVNVTIQLPEKSMTEVPEVAAQARALAESLEEAYPAAEIHLTGVIMLNNAFGEAAREDVATLFPAMFAIMVLLIGLLLRSITGTAVIVIVLFTSVGSALGLAGYLGWKLTPPSAAAPTVILTVAVADSVHLLAVFFHYLRQGFQKAAAMQRSLAVNFQAVFITSLTTAVGFLTMNFSDSPPFRDLGNIAAIGVTTAFLLSVTLLPALVVVLPIRARSDHSRLASMMDRLADLVIRRRRILLWTLSLSGLTLMTFIPRSELNDDLIRYFDKTVEFRQASEFSNDNLTGIYTLEYSVDAGHPGGINEPAFLRKVDDFARWLKSQPEVMHVNTISDTFKRINKSLHGDDPTFYRLPRNRELAAQALLLYEMSLPYGLDLNDQINVDKSATRITVTIRNDLSTGKILALEKRVTERFQKIAPDIGISSASATLMFAHIGERNMRSMLVGTAIALVLISSILLLIFRSVKIGIVSLIPNLVPPAVAFGLWGLAVAEINLSLSIVASLTLGIVVDDTVHFLSKYLAARRTEGLSSEAAVRYAFSSVGAATVITSLVLACGFSILVTSSFTSNADMGVMVSATVVFALISDMLLLPSLLLKLEDKRNEKAFDRNSIPSSAA